VLKFIRSNKAASWVKVMFAAIVLVFVFWGVGVGVGGDQYQLVADVNGETIDQVQLERVQRNLSNFYRQVYKDNPELIDQLDLRKQGVEQLVRVALLRQEAQSLGLGVADDEIRATIAADANFQIDGLFDKDRYLRLLRMNMLTPGQYENSQREELLVNKLTELVLAGVRVSEAEARSAFTRDGERIKLRYVTLDAETFADSVEVSDEEARAHFEAHAANFVEPDRVRLDYVVFDPTRYADDIEVSDEQITADYEARRDEFDQPESVRARHILLRLAPDADVETKAEVAGRAAGVLLRLAAGEDFAAVAREVSEDSSNAPDGGDLGFFPRGRMVPAFEEAAFALEPGQVSEIIETQFGLHILRVDEKREAGVRPLDEVRDEIVVHLRATAATELAKKAAEEAQVEASGGKELAEVVSGAGLSLQSSNLVGRTDNIEGLRGSAAVIDAALGSGVGQVGPVVLTVGGHVVFRVAERVDSFVPEFDAVAERVRAAARLAKAAEVAGTRGEELRTKIAESSIDAVAEAEGLPIQEAGPLSRGGAWIAGIGLAPELKEAAFALTLDAPVAPQVYTVNDKQVIAVLSERIAPSEEEFNAQKDTLIGNLEVQRRNEVIAAFVADLRGRASIKLGRGFADLG